MNTLYQNQPNTNTNTPAQAYNPQDPINGPIYDQNGDYYNPHRRDAVRTVKEMQQTVERPETPGDAINNLTKSDWEELNSKIGPRPEMPAIDPRMLHHAGDLSNAALSKTGVQLYDAITRAYGHNADSYRRAIVDAYGKLSDQQQARLGNYNTYLNNQGQIANTGTAEALRAGSYALGSNMTAMDNERERRARMAEADANRKQAMYDTINTNLTNAGYGMQWASASAQDLYDNRNTPMSDQLRAYNAVVNPAPNASAAIQDPQESQMRAAAAAASSPVNPNNRVGMVGAVPSAAAVPGMSTIPLLDSIAAKSRAKSSYEADKEKLGAIQALSKHKNNLSEDYRTREEWGVMQDLVRNLVASAETDTNFFTENLGNSRNMNTNLERFFAGLEDKPMQDRIAAVQQFLKGGGSEATRSYLDNLWLAYTGPRWGNSQHLVKFQPLDENGNPVEGYQYWDASRDKLMERLLGPTMTNDKGERVKAPGGYTALEALDYFGAMPNVDDKVRAEAIKAQQAQAAEAAAATRGAKNDWGSSLGLYY